MYETDKVHANLKYLQLLAKDYPNIAEASSEIIRLQATLKLPKGTEHFMSDLHGEYDAFTHILNNASGVIKEKVDKALGDWVSEQERSEFATLIYYPVQKLPELKKKQKDLDKWYHQILVWLIDVCRIVSSKHTRQFVRSNLPEGYEYILDELLHAHFEDHNKDMYYGQIFSSIITIGRADDFIIAMCTLIKRLAVYKLHIVGDIFDRGPRPDIILEKLMAHHSVDIQWGNHDVVWMGAAAGSPICILTVLKTTLAFNNVEVLEDGYGINLRRLARFSDEVYTGHDISCFMPRVDESRGPYLKGRMERVARMHKAISIMMFKLECEVIDRNPDFMMADRTLIREIDYEKGTIHLCGKDHPMKDMDFPTVDPADPARLTEQEQFIIQHLVHSFKQSEKLQKHVRFLFGKGSVYKIENGNLLFHGAVPMTKEGEFANETFEGKQYAGRALMDYCERRARHGYYAPEGSAEREAGMDFLWYLWCGPLSPVFGRGCMTTFERLFVADKSTYTEPKDPYYVHYNDASKDCAILAEFGLDEAHGHIINGHVPVRAVEGESPLKGDGRLIVIDGGFCRAYHERTGIAGYTLIYNSRGLSLRVHEPFKSMEDAVNNNRDIISRVDVIEHLEHRMLIEDTDQGKAMLETIEDLKMLLAAYRQGLIKQNSPIALNSFS